MEHRSTGGDVGEEREEDLHATERLEGHVTRVKSSIRPFFLHMECLLYFKLARRFTYHHQELICNGSAVQAVVLSSANARSTTLSTVSSLKVRDEVMAV